MPVIDGEEASSASPQNRSRRRWISNITSRNKRSAYEEEYLIPIIATESRSEPGQGDIKNQEGLLSSASRFFKNFRSKSAAPNQMGQGFLASSNTIPTISDETLPEKWQEDVKNQERPLSSVSRVFRNFHSKIVQLIQVQWGFPSFFNLTPAVAVKEIARSPCEEEYLIPVISEDNQKPFEPSKEPIENIVTEKPYELCQEEAEVKEEAICPSTLGLFSKSCSKTAPSDKKRFGCSLFQSPISESPPLDSKYASLPPSSLDPPPALIPQGPYQDRIRVPIPQRITMSHTEGENYTNCFATNFTKAQLLLSGEYIPGKLLHQIDLIGDRFDEITYAASGGLIIRYVPKKDGQVRQILGFNAYYDYRQGNIGYFNQLGAGIEILGKRWDFRANVYVPVGGKRKLRHCVFNNYGGGYFAIQDSFESVSYAYNAEIGWLLINSKSLLLYLAGGPYYIAGRKCFDKTRGGEFRIQPQYKDFIALNAIVSHDPLFQTVYQFEVIVHLPLYLISKKISKKETCGLTPRQIYQPVIRQDVMPIGRCSCWMFNWNDLL